MNTYLSIKEQICIVEEILTKAEQSLKQKPAGCLIIRRRGNHSECYLQEEKTKKRLYLSRKNIALARELAQKQYDRECVSCASELLEELHELEKREAVRSAAAVYEKLAAVYNEFTPERKKLIEPYVLPDEEYIDEWLGETYKHKSFSEDAPEIYTEKNERVRSKSEKMIADKLCLLGIPYRYEYPMILPGIGSIHPDFLLLDIKERTTVIYEHFGIMQDPVYCRNALRKIDTYEKNGYMLGNQLICTFESEDHVLDMRHFEKLMGSRFA